MKKFLIDIAVFFVIVFIGYLAISFLVNQTPAKSNDYMSSMEDKHNRAKSIKKPKIILGGGSNWAFGINSERLQERFSVPVVNLGLHAGLGVEYMINEVKECVHTNDVVFISIEYFLGEGDYKLKNHTRYLYPEASKFYSKNFIKEIQTHLDKTRDNLKEYNQTTPPEIVSHVYWRDGFNRYGDLIAHLDKKPTKKLHSRAILNYKYWQGIDILNDFYTFAQSNNIHVFFLYPNYAKSEFEINKKAIYKLQKDISQNLFMEVINSPQDFVFADSLFYDTVYHLNKKGRELRTTKLIEIIENNTTVKNCIRAIKK